MDGVRAHAELACDHAERSTASDGSDHGPTAGGLTVSLVMVHLSRGRRFPSSLPAERSGCSVICPVMVMSYFGRVAERCSRASIGFISLAGTRTPSGYAPLRRFTVGCRPFHLIRRAHCRTTFRQVSNTPFHFFSSADQHRSIGLYLLWYGG